MTLPKLPIVTGPPSLGYLPSSSDVSSTGAYSHSIPLDVPPGRNAMEPTLSISYTSGSGNGLLGVGFSLGGEVMSTITRCHKTLASEGIRDGVDYDPPGDGSDAFCLDGNKLVAINGSYGAHGTEYRTEHETFSQIFSYLGANTNAPQHFVVKLKNGRIRTYAAAEITRYSATKASYTALDEPFYQRWTLSKEEDRSGNQVLYTWEAVEVPSEADAVISVSFRPSTIMYTAHSSDPAMRRITFAYEDRRDRVQFGWQAGVRFAAHERLERITMEAPSPAKTTPVWQYVFDYATSDYSGKSLLVGVRKCGLPGGTTCSWTKTFQWHSAAKDGSPWTEKLIDTQSFGYHPGSRVTPYVYAFDADADGADELIVQRGTDWAKPNVLFYRNLKGTPIMQPAAANGSTFTIDQRIEMALPLDIEGDGRSEVFLTRWMAPGHCDDKIVRWDASTQRFVTTWTMPIDSCGTVNAPTRPGLLYDVNGDGLLDFLRTPSPLSPNTPNVWSVALNLGGSFQAPPLWQTSITRDALLTRAVDFDGDGRVEIFGENFFTKKPATHALDDTSGWVTENDTTNKFPALKRSGTKTAKQLAAEFHLLGDFNGDGLQDSLRFVPPLSYNANSNAYECPDGWGCQWDGAALAWVGFLRWNTGNGFGPETTVPLNELVSVNCNTNPNNITEVCGATEVTVRVADVNRDGRQDLVLFAHRIGKAVTDDIRVLISSGEPASGAGVTFTRHTIAAGGGFWNRPYDYLGAYWAPEEAYTSSTLGDFNGDGFLDIVRVVPSGVCSENESQAITCPDTQIKLLLQSPQYGDYLASVTDEPTKWPRERVTYSTAISDRPEASAGCTYPKRCVKPGMVVVREVESRAHVINPPVIQPTLPAARTIHYSYEDPVADVRGRGFLGFRKFRIWDPARPMEQVYEFDNHTPWLSNDGPYLYALRPYRITSVVPVDPVIGGAGTGVPATKVNARVTRGLYYGTLLKLNANKSYADLPYSYQVDEWEQMITVDWGPLDSINPTSEHIYTVTQPVTTLRATAGSGVTYDEYGNETSRTDTVVRPGSFDTGNTISLTSTFDYSFTASWLVALPKKYVVTAKEYENPAVSVSRSLEFDYETNGTGRLWHIYREKDSPDTTQRQTITFSYDLYGNITSLRRQVADATVPSRETRLEYGPLWPGQPDERIFVSQVWQPFTPLEYRPSRWVAYHPALGVPSATKDVNGVTEQATYDQLGRVVSVSPAGAAMTKISYAGRVDNYGGLNGTETTLTQAGAQVVLRTDALGRAIQEQRKGFDNTLVSQDIVYDGLGRVRRVYRPYQGTQAQALYTTTLSYDPLDRPRKGVLPDNKTVEYQHDFWSTTFLDPLGKKTRIERDVNDRVIEASGFLGPTKVATRYSYLPFGLLRQVNDPAISPALGHATTFAYDSLGRRIEMMHPDHGATTTTYDGFDQVTKEAHTATAEETTYAYDALGREIGNTGPTGTNTYVWDTQPSGIGKLASASSPDKIQLTYAYDAFGRPSSLVQKVDASSYTIGFTYDSLFGLPEEIRYPSIDHKSTPGLAVKYTYNAPGYLTEVGYSTSSNSYTKLLTVKDRTLDDRLRTALLGGTTPALTLTRNYDAATGRPTLVNAVTSASIPVFNLAYAYFANGLVASRTDTLMNRTERFTYDDLGRLDTWLASYNGANRTMAYTYTTDGNLKTVTLDGTVIEEDTYGQNNAPPHALTTQLLDGATQTAYAYDVRGRQTTGGTRTVNGYSQGNLPRSVTKSGTVWNYSYDAFGHRVHADGLRTTTYVAGLYEKRVESGVTTHVFHVLGDDGPIAELTRLDAATNPTVNFLIADALGTIAAVATGTGGISSRLFFEPFGKRITADGANFTATVGMVKEGLTGHEYDDELGLINMTGRVYDPQLKRFATPDPVLSGTLNGQNLNGYSYVRNSPLNLTDPSGLWTKNSICGVDGFTDCAQLLPPGGAGSQVPGGSQGPMDWRAWHTQQKGQGGVKQGPSKAKDPTEAEFDKKNKGAAPMQASSTFSIPGQVCVEGEQSIACVGGEPVKGPAKGKREGQTPIASSFRTCAGPGDSGCSFSDAEAWFLRNAESIERGLVGASAVAAGIATGLIFPEAAAAAAVAMRGAWMRFPVPIKAAGSAILGLLVRSYKNLSQQAELWHAQEVAWELSSIWAAEGRAGLVAQVQYEAQTPAGRRVLETVFRRLPEIAAGYDHPNQVAYLHALESVLYHTLHGR